MVPPSRFRMSSWVVASAIALAPRARAGSPDPRTLRDQLEQQVLDGDRDGEDLATLHFARQGAPSRRGGSAYLGISGYAAERVDGRRELGVMLIFQLPLERFARVPPPPPPLAAPLETTIVPPFDALGEAPVGPASSPAGVSEPTQVPAGHAAPPVVVVTTGVARACVRAAWKALGLADDSRIDSMAQRARTSAMLPELRLRAAHTIDESGRLTVTDTDPGRYTEVGAATSWLEARLTFQLDRLLFAEDEVSLERIRIERSELRSRTSAKVLQALFEWQRAYALVQEPTLSTEEHFAAVLRELEASAILDVMTDGWFARFRASLGKGTE
ncbi:MAG TPA: hypothetical protein VF881_14865 [Polyangiaceae bacterium]